MKTFRSNSEAIKNTIYDIDFFGDTKEEAVEIGATAIECFDRVLTILHRQGITRQRAKEILEAGGLFEINPKKDGSV
jgi:hypothetical protein